MATLTVCIDTKVSVGLRKDSKVPQNLKDLSFREVYEYTLKELWKLHVRRGVHITPQEYDWLIARMLKEVLRNKNGRLGGRWKSIENWANAVWERSVFLEGKFADFEEYLRSPEGKKRIELIKEVKQTKNRIKLTYSTVHEYLYARHVNANLDEVLSLERKYIGWVDELMSKQSFWNVFMAGVFVENAMMENFTKKIWWEWIYDAQQDSIFLKKAYSYTDGNSLAGGFERAFRELLDESVKDIFREAFTMFVAEVGSGLAGDLFRKGVAVALRYLGEGALILANLHPALRGAGAIYKLLKTSAQWFETSILTKLAVWVGVEWQVDGAIQIALSNLFRTLKMGDPEILGLTKEQWERLFALTRKMITGEGGISEQDIQEYNDLLSQLDEKGRWIHTALVQQAELKYKAEILRTLWDDEAVQKKTRISMKIAEQRKKYIDIVLNEIDITQGKIDEQEFRRKVELANEILRRWKTTMLEEVYENAKREQWERRKKHLSDIWNDPQYWKDERHTYTEVNDTFVMLPPIYDSNISPLPAGELHKWENYSGLDVWRDWGTVVFPRIFDWQALGIRTSDIWVSGHILCCAFEARYDSEITYGVYFKQQGTLFERKDILRLLAEGFSAEKRTKIARRGEDAFITMNFKKKTGKLKVKYRGDCTVVIEQIKRVRKILQAQANYSVEVHTAYTEKVSISQAYGGTGATCWIPEECPYDQSASYEYIKGYASGGKLEIAQRLEGNLITLEARAQSYFTEIVGRQTEWGGVEGVPILRIAKENIDKVLLGRLFDIQIKERVIPEFVLCTKKIKTSECTHGYRVHPPRITCVFNYQK